MTWKHFIGLILLIVFLSLAEAFTPPAKAADRALLVGVENYRRSDITRVIGADNDVKAIGQVLVRHAGFSADEARTIILSSDNSNRRSEKGEIVSKLEFISHFAQPGDTLVFYFSGHGMTHHNQGYLLPYDANLSSDYMIESSCLPINVVSQILAKSKASRVLLFLDACRNRPEADRSAQDNNLTEYFSRSVNFGPLDRQNAAGKPPEMTVIYSCQIGHRAYDLPSKRRGAFSYVLEKALSGPAVKNRRIDLADLESYLSVKVPELLALERGVRFKQNPMVAKLEFDQERGATPIKTTSTTTYRPSTTTTSTTTVSTERWIKDSYGIVRDTQTNLEWYVGPDEATNWHEASKWVKGLSVDGGGWRMPTISELKGLYKNGLGTRNMTPLLETTGWWVWSSESFGSSSSWSFFFDIGDAYCYPRNDSNPRRAFAVRSRR